MRILIFSQYFWPENFTINNITKTLNSKFELEVLTGQPNYPSGKIYKGFKWWGLESTYENNFYVNRVPIFPRGNNSKIKLIMNYLFFIFSASFFGFIKMWKKKFDIIFCFAPSPILQAIPGIFISKLTKAKFVLYVQDLWPESLSATGNIKSPLILNIIDKFVSFIYKKSDLILVSSKPFKDNIKKYVNPNKIRYLPNSIDLTDQNLEAKINPDLDNYLTNYFSCVFTGNLGKAQSLETIVDAALMLSNYKDIKILIFGYGNQFDILSKNIKKKSLKNIILMGAYPSNYMPIIMSKANCLIASLKNEEIFKLTIPYKIQSYMSSGRPIIASIPGEGARLVIESGAGIACEPENASSMSKAILKLKSLNDQELKKFGINGKSFFFENFEHQKVMNKLISFLEDVQRKK